MFVKKKSHFPKWLMLLAGLLLKVEAHNSIKPNFDLSKRGRSGSLLLSESDDPSETDENDSFIEDDQIINGTKFLFETSSTFEESSSTNERLPRTPIISTRYGKIQGRVHTLPIDELYPKVEIFQGIPYATPPVGSNRWQPTRAPSPWEGVLQATTPGPVCPQKLPDIRNETEALTQMPKQRLRFLQMIRPQLLRQSEDCLYLNIFIPADAKSSGEEERKALRPIMIYVHGESFSWGSGNLWDGRVLATQGNVIVITFNFRLGILGFLNTNGSPLTRGQVSNYGIMDQIAVLQWVQENIGHFGGDPAQVTLFGHGTGAACIEYLSHSPTTVPGLFRRVILMSGSMFSSWARVRDPLNYALQLAKHFNCSIPNDLTNDHDQIVNCLRTISAERLLGAKLNVPSFHLEFGPSFDGITIKDNFSDMKWKRSFGASSYEALLGVVSHDYFDSMSDEELTTGITLPQRDRILKNFVRNQYNAHLQEILLTLQNEYTDWQQVNQQPSTTRDMVLQALSDGLYVSPAVFSAGTFLKKSKNTFFYHFLHRSKMDPYEELRSGSTHGSELAYVFGIPVCNVWRHVLFQFTKSEMALSKAIMTMWTNFAKSGSPNLPVRLDESKTRFRGIQWEPYDEYQKYLELGNSKGHKMAVWLNLIPQLQKTGQNAIYPSHNSLMESPPGTACMTLAESQRVLHQQNSTITLLENASRDAYSYALAAALSLGGILCVLNGVLLLYLCRRNPVKRTQSGINDQTTHSEMSRAGSEADFFNSTPRRSNLSNTSNSLPRGGRQTLLIQQRESSLSTSASRPDLPLTSEVSPLRPASSMSVTTATIRLRPSGNATTGRCFTHGRSHQTLQTYTHQKQVYPNRSSLDQHHHNHQLGREEHISIAAIHPDTSTDQELIQVDELPAPPAQFNQDSPGEIPEQLRRPGFSQQSRIS